VAKLLLEPERGVQEEQAFEPLAKRFGGEVEFVETTSESYAGR
jgi:hypothetical protein